MDTCAHKKGSLMGVEELMSGCNDMPIILPTVGVYRYRTCPVDVSGICARGEIYGE